MVWITCSDCDFGDENPQTMTQHVLEAHPNYTPDEVEHFVTLWQEDAYEREELSDIERAEYFRRHGIDPEDIDRDPL